MLLNKLYVINDLQFIENNIITAKIHINKEHEIFKGHFPNQPVVPGVCLTNIVTDVISQSRGKSHFLKSADYIKFINIVEPSVHSDLFARIKLEETDGLLKAEGSFFSENTVFFKIKARFLKNGE
jgi:3-hydroxyacyl-[acyl-carrier-protein] dehydratase